MVMASEINLVPTCSYFDVETPTGSIIPCRGWGDVHEAKAAIVLVHGLGAHAGWFEAVGRLFKVRNIYAVAYDQAGFGQRSRRAPASYMSWLDELNTVFSAVREQMELRPTFLLGNSMGALVAASVAHKLEPAGLILSAAAFAANRRFFTPWFVLRTMLKALIDPSYEVPRPYPLELISRDPVVQEWILHDANYRNTVPAGTLLQINHLKNNLLRHTPPIPCPLLMLSAQQDFVVENNVSRRVFEKLICPSKTFKEMPGAYHDLMLDPCLDDVIAEIVLLIHSCSPELVSACF